MEFLPKSRWNHFCKYASIHYDHTCKTCINISVAQTSFTAATKFQWFSVVTIGTLIATDSFITWITLTFHQRCIDVYAASVSKVVSGKSVRTFAWFTFVSIETRFTYLTMGSLKKKSKIRKEYKKKITKDYIRQITKVKLMRQDISRRFSVPCTWILQAIIMTVWNRQNVKFFDGVFRDGR